MARLGTVTSLHDVKRRKRKCRLERRVERLEVLLAKRKAELAQLGEYSKRLWWVSFMSPAGGECDIVVRGKNADAAFVAAARLLDDPIGDPVIFEVPRDLWKGPIGVEIHGVQIQRAARLALQRD